MFDANVDIFRCKPANHGVYVSTLQMKTTAYSTVKTARFSIGRYCRMNHDT